MSDRKQPRYDLEQIKLLFFAGLDDKQIAEKLGRAAPSAWRTIQSIRLKNGLTHRPGNKPANPEKHLDIIRDASIVGGMSPEERVVHFEKKFKESPRFAYMFETLSAKEVEIFQKEYLKVLTEIEDLNMTEEQSLFLATYELVLALRAQKNRKNEEDLLERCRSGKIKSDDATFINSVSDRYDKEYTAHMKQYQSLIDDLKLSRKQRLEREIKTKKSFLDYAYEFSDEAAQKSIAEEIRRLNKLDDAELKNLIEKGYLMGYFENKESI